MAELIPNQCFKEDFFQKLLIPTDFEENIHIKIISRLASVACEQF